MVVSFQSFIFLNRQILFSSRLCKQHEILADQNNQEERVHMNTKTNTYDNHP
jgi:hypothetical protein